MATRLEIAKNKLTRLENEVIAATENVFKHQALTNGQPMNDKRNAHSFFKRQNQLENKTMNLQNEVVAQRERVEMLERQAWNKANGLTRSGGLATSVENIDRLKARIQQHEEEIARGKMHTYTKRALYQDKKTLAQLLKIKAEAEECSARISDKTKQLIDLGFVNQWRKKPIYYFVNGLRKVALEIDENGKFKVSQRYPTKNEAESNFVKKLLEG